MKMMFHIRYIGRKEVKDKIHTKLQHFLKISRGSMPPKPPSKAHGKFLNLKLNIFVPRSHPLPFTNPGYAPDILNMLTMNVSFFYKFTVILLVVPHQKTNKHSEKAFAVVGPRLWNELLTDEFRGCNSVDTFKKKLKTMLFKKHY